MQGIDNLPKSGGSSTLSGLSDVNFSSLTEGDLLIYDGAEWINSSFTEGHTILNESGTSVTARDNLQFTDGLKVTDDSGNNKTKVGVNTTFTEASTRANIDSGDTFSTILGKIKKFFTDLKAVAFSGSYNDLSDKPTIPVGSDYVQKSGDTMTGRLDINTSGQVPLGLDRSHSSTTSQRVAFDVGNNIPDGTAGSTYGEIALFGKGAYYTSFGAQSSTNNRSIGLPDEDGTVALKESKGVYVKSVEATGNSQTSSLSSYVGHMAMVRVKVDDNNYYNLTGVDVIGQSSFVTMHGFGGNSSYTEISAVVRYSSGKYNCLRVLRSGTDVTGNAKLIIYVL